MPDLCCGFPVLLPVAASLAVIPFVVIRGSTLFLSGSLSFLALLLVFPRPGCSQCSLSFLICGSWTSSCNEWSDPTCPSQLCRSPSQYLLWNFVWLFSSCRGASSPAHHHLSLLTTHAYTHTHIHTRTHTQATIHTTIIFDLGPRTITPSSSLTEATCMSNQAVWKGSRWT